MFTPARHTKPSKLKVFLLNWACIFPVVLLLSAVLRWALARFDLPEWTFTALLTGLLTFSIVYFIGPWLDRTLGSGCAPLERPVGTPNERRGRFWCSSRRGEPVKQCLSDLGTGS